MLTPAFTPQERGLIRAYIRSGNEAYYQRAFTRYRLGGDSLSWCWSWGAFLGGPLFLLYRKRYLEATILFVVGLFLHSLPFGTILYMIARGGTLPYLIYRHFRAELAYAQTLSDDPTEWEKHLTREGGTSLLALLLGLALYAILAIGAALYFGLSLALILLTLGVAEEFI